MISPLVFIFNPFPEDFLINSEDFRQNSHYPAICKIDLPAKSINFKYMKISQFLFFVLFSIECFGQNLQIHYDFRHSVDPNLNSKNFPGFVFEYFKDLDTLGTGSFMLKLQTDFNGNKSNVGQVFTQISQSIKFWKPKIYFSANYSGGLGVTPDSYGYYIANSFGIGVAYPFQWRGAWVATSLLFRYNSFEKPSYDPQFTFYFGRGFLNYRIFTDGSFVCWTENRNRGDNYTASLKGKKFAFFGDPKIWIKVNAGFSMGTKFNVFYNLLGGEGKIQIYPTIGAKYQF